MSPDVGTRARAAIKWGLMRSGARPRTVFAGSARGVRLAIDPRTQTRLFLGLYEIELERAIRQFCGAGTVGWDIGGNVGYDALMMARLGARHVTTFEPDPQMRQSLSANLTLNPDLADRIEVRDEFVGSTTGVNQVRLDDLLRNGVRPTFLKIDVDGGEAEVLDGAREALAEARPHVIVETHSLELEEQCGRLLVDAGYEPRIRHQRSLLPDRRPIPHNRWLIARGQP